LNLQAKVVSTKNTCNVCLYVKHSCLEKHGVVNQREENGR